MKTDLKIVIADDEAIRLMTLKAQLLSLGHKVVGEASTGRAAVEETKDKNPDLVILDIRMPEMDGLEAARAITEHKPVPLIMLTAYSDRDLVREATLAGAFAYLVKPVTELDLMPAIDLAISRFEELNLLKEEVGNLQNALKVRADVEKAKGILMERCRLTEEAAFDRMRLQSSREGRKVVEIARSIITAHGLF